MVILGSKDVLEQGRESGMVVEKSKDEGSERLMFWCDQGDMY